MTDDPITAYHGSPHEFDQFDTSKIGTGEGAQAYGHGLYFAESEPVAKGYRDRLGGHIPGAIKIGDETHPHWARKDVAKAFSKLGYDPQTSVIAAHQINEHKGDLDKASASIWENEHIPDSVHDALHKAEYATPAGHMYEVHIDAHPDHFLDWDKPLSEQPYVKQKLVDAEAIHPNEELTFMYNGLARHGKEMYERLTSPLAYRLTGGEGQKSASDFLQRAGIRGIKYLNAGSRSAGEGSRNYVVFDPKDIEIMRRYARGGDVRAHFNDGGEVNDTSYWANLLRGLQSIPETAYNYLTKTSYDQMGSDAVNLAKNVYHDVTEHPVENLLGALPIVGSGMSAYDAYKLNDRIKHEYKSGNYETAQNLERALVLSSLGAIPILGELSSVGSSAARMAEEAALHGAAETGSRAIFNAMPRDAYHVAENITSNKINQALDSAKKHMFSNVNDERETIRDIGHASGGRAHFGFGGDTESEGSHPERGETGTVSADVGPRAFGAGSDVGGEGIKEYYDKIVPNQLKKIVKNYDPNAKVGYTDVMLPPSGKAGTNNPPMAAPGLDITPQMRKAIMQGQKAYADGGYVDGIDAPSILESQPPIEIPRSLKELQNWQKTHSRQNRPSMDDVFTARMSGFEGATPISMPANLAELQAYTRTKRATGGRIPEVDKLFKAAKRTLDGETKPMLNMHDDDIVKALRVAQRRI